MNKSKEENQSDKPEFNGNMWGWRWTWFSLGLIIVAAIFVIFVEPGEGENYLEKNGQAVIDTLETDTLK